MSRSNYNAKAREWLRRCGYASIAKVEVYRVDPIKNPSSDRPAGRFHDLFGFVDYLAVGKGHTLAVQVCRWTDVSNRLQKLHESPHVLPCLEAGWKVIVVGFRPGEASPHRIVDVTSESVRAALALLEEAEEQEVLF